MILRDLLSDFIFWVPRNLPNEGHETTGCKHENYFLILISILITFIILLSLSVEAMRTEMHLLIIFFFQLLLGLYINFHIIISFLILFLHLCRFKLESREVHKGHVQHQKSIINSVSKL